MNAAYLGAPVVHVVGWSSSGRAFSTNGAIGQSFDKMSSVSRPPVSSELWALRGLGRQLRELLAQGLDVITQIRSA